MSQRRFRPGYMPADRTPPTSLESKLLKVIEVPVRFSHALKWERLGAGVGPRAVPFNPFCDCFVTRHPLEAGKQLVGLRLRTSTLR